MKMISIIGTGMDGKNTLTYEGRRAIEGAELIIGAGRTVKPYENSLKEIFISYKPDEITEKIRNSSSENIAVLMSGDCVFFSGTKKLLPLLEGLGGCEIKVICGVSSAAYLCSRTGLTYESMKFISLHGVRSNIAVNVRLNEKCFFLLGGDQSVSDVCEKLCQYGLPDVKVCIGENLGYENEKIISASAGELRNYSGEKLASIITVNEGYLKYIPGCISDREFIRSEKIPMTKSEIRSIAVSLLNISSDSVCWDIGSGTGSVSVEMAFRCPDGRVFSFDKNIEAYSLTRENSEQFGCDNIVSVNGNCPEILAGAEIPDKVFIGGSSGNMRDIFKMISEKNPRADIVITAVSIETLNDSKMLFEEYGAEYSIVQISVARTGRIGSHTMLNALNPVFIIKGRLIE